MTLKNTNLLSILTDSLHSDDAPFMYCTIINSLTSATCSQMMNHLYAVRRGIPDDASLDERNEQDEAKRGEEVADFLTDSNGYKVPMKSLEAARICDGIRHNLYADMFGWGDFLTEAECDGKDPLVYTPVLSITARPNYAQPMSAQMYMDFRIDNAERLNELEIQMAVKRIKGVTEAVVREALLQEARKNKIRLMEMKPTVISEIDSFIDDCEIDAFKGLDMDLQCYVADKIAARLDREFQRLLPKAVRSLEFAGQLETVQNMHALVKDWLKEHDEELNAAMQLRKSLAA